MRARTVTTAVVMIVMIVTTAVVMIATTAVVMIAKTAVVMIATITTTTGAAGGIEIDMRIDLDLQQGRVAALPWV